jgi:WD40 repeat protein
VAFSPDGRHIASGSARLAEAEPSYLKVWDATTGREVLDPRGDGIDAACVAFSPGDGRWIVTGSASGDIIVWDATTGKQRHKLSGHDTFVSSVAFSPDGRRLASLSYLGGVVIHDATRWGEMLRQDHLLRFPAHKMSVRGSLAFSPDGKRLVAPGGVPGDENTVNIWDMTTADKPPTAPLLTLRGHTAQVWGVAFSPDGRWVASGGEDNMVRLWDATTGELVHPFRGHSSIVSRVAFSFSPEGKRLASASYDKTVKLWDLASLHEKAR